jgi:hypothetical protein
MAAEVQIARERDGSFTAAGTWLGRQLSDSLFAEPLDGAKHQIRYCTPSSGPRRIGEVQGSRGRYCAFDHRSQLVAIARSLAAAAQTLMPPQPLAKAGPSGARS